MMSAERTLIKQRRAERQHEECERTQSGAKALLGTPELTRKRGGQAAVTRSTQTRKRNEPRFCAKGSAPSDPLEDFAFFQRDLSHSKRYTSFDV